MMVAAAVVVIMATIGERSDVENCGFKNKITK